MKNLINKSWALFIVMVILVACTKNFETLNKDPNAPGLGQAAPSMLLTNAIYSMTNRLNETFLGEEMGNCWVQHEAKVQYTDEDRYIPRVGVINNTWTSFYAANGEDVATILKIANQQNLPNYKGIALVLKSYIVSVLTDLYGDVPYSEAWRATLDDGGILSPKYDSQQSIYEALLANLDTANLLLDPAAGPIAGDILYGNDISKWKKFANSLKVRLLLRISDQEDPTTALTKIFNDPDTYPVFESNDDDAQLNYLGPPNSNPRYDNRQTRDDHRVSKTITDFMWTASSYVDWRICIFAELDGNSDFEGMPNGLTSADAAAYNGGGLKYTSKIGEYFTRGTTPGVLMSYSELLFAKAEAEHKGYISGGDAAAGNDYLDGIYANYDHYGQDLVDKANAYFDLGASTPKDLADDFITNESHQWNPANAMQLIGEEKWITLFDQGIEAWTEWRRLDFPVLTPAAAGALSGKMPVRVYYPSDEASRNQTNWKAAKSAQSLTGDADMLTKVWWDVN